eukprot:1189261-Prorocentrum_minimum.AAC.5
MSKAYELDDGQACIRQTDWDVGEGLAHRRRAHARPQWGGAPPGARANPSALRADTLVLTEALSLRYAICPHHARAGGDRGGADWTARSAAIGRADHRVRQQQRRHRGGHHDGPRGDPHRRPRLHPPAPPRHAPGATALAVLIAILAHWPNPRHSCLVSCPGNFGTSIAMDGVGERRVLSD